MKDFLLKNSARLLTIVSIGLLYNYMSHTEDRVNQRIESTINRLMPQFHPKDTAKYIVARPLASKGTYHYFDGKVKGESHKMVSEYDYYPDFPIEVWNGYITLVEANNGADYFMWSEYPVKDKSDLTGWVIADSHQFQLKGKKYIQMIFPIVAVKKPIKL